MTHPRSENLPRPRPEALHHNSNLYLRAPGCSNCKDRELCGGIHTANGLLDCTVNCCGKPADCRWVCRRNPQFLRQVQELRGLHLTNVTIKATRPVPQLPSSAPLIYHGYKRHERLVVPAVAVKLAQLYDRRSGLPRFQSRSELCAYFKIAETASIIISGVDEDPVIERWNGIGKRARARVLTTIHDIGPALVTTPNFSVCLDWPRTGDLASMKRIALCLEEFAEAGILASLHAHGRTDTDFDRWGVMLRQNPAITHLSYEFTTGTALASRRQQHVEWLSSLPQRAERALDLVVYGDGAIAASLQPAFGQVTWIETTSFMKTINRLEAVRSGNGRLAWQTPASGRETPLDRLLPQNIHEAALQHAIRRAA